MLEQLNIALGIFFVLTACYIWYTIAIVKDGIARLMLLWGNGFIIGMLTFRTFGFILAYFGVLDIVESRTWNQYVIFFIYALVIGELILLSRKDK